MNKSEPAPWTWHPAVPPIFALGSYRGSNSSATRGTLNYSKAPGTWSENGSEPDALPETVTTPQFWVLRCFHPGAPFKHVYVEASPTGRDPWTDYDVTKPAQFPAGLRIHRKLVILVR